MIFIEILKDYFKMSWFFYNLIIQNHFDNKS
jgi:hypothetical protein